MYVVLWLVELVRITYCRTTRCGALGGFATLARCLLKCACDAMARFVCVVYLKVTTRFRVLGGLFDKARCCSSVGYLYTTRWRRSGVLMTATRFT